MTTHGPLGASVSYPSCYSPELLYRIPRATGRNALGLDAAALHGADIWNAYELSWLNAKGKPQVAWGRFEVPADSPHIVESKSFKLYLNSFNQHRLDSVEEFTALLRADVSRCVGSDIAVSVLPPDQWQGIVPTPSPRGWCLDDLDISPTVYQPDANLLDADGAQPVAEQLYSNLLRSRCPVTGQPDWGSVLVDYRGPRLDREALLRYIISFREHDDFHEHCVERIYRDILLRCQPEYLTVSARYLRRGGLDINPWRSSDPNARPDPARLARQ